jgi:hypothetical protein
MAGTSPAMKKTYYAVISGGRGVSKNGVVVGCGGSALYQKCGVGAV